MKKRFTFLIAAIALLTVITLPMKAWADNDPDVTYDFTSSSWTVKNTVSTDIDTLTNGTVSFTGAGGTNFKMHGDGYFFLGKSGAYLNFPTYASNVEKIVITGRSGASGSVKQNIYVGNVTVSSETTGATGSNTYQIATAYQTAGTQYTLKVTSDHNTQITKIEIFFASNTYTIEALSNDETYGTVALNGSVITGSPKTDCRYASPAYSVSPANSATVVQNGNQFTVTPSANTTVTINFEAIPTHTVTFSVNEATTSQSFLEGAAVVFPSNPANISGKKFVGWVTEEIAEPTDEEPSFVNTATETMGNSDVTYYAVFATATASSELVETKTQTLQYDTWTYRGSTTDKTTYRLFHTNSYIESAAFDLSKLNKVIVYGGTFGGDSYNSLTIGDGTNVWKSVTVSGSSQTGTNTYTGGTALTGTKALRVTSNSGTASSTGVRISKVEIFTMETQYTYSGYCTSFEVYTIAAVSNNTEFGTVSLSGEVITGAPQTGCRYASPAYTVTVGTATVSQSGNDFTVTPASNCTVRINFEAIPTFTLSSDVSPAGAGTVTLGASSGLLEGATVSAEAAANAGYKFTSWSISGTDATLSSTTSNPTTVTIGTGDATVTAIFEEVTTYAITYSVNGVTNTVNVEENTAVDFSAPNSALIPVGYVFKGWRTSAISTPTDTEPTDYVTSATSTEDITYYAVMAAESLSNSTWTLNYNNESDLASSTDWGAYGKAFNYTASDGGTWTVKAYKNSGMQINNGKDCSIKVPTCSGYIQSIAITCSAAKAVGFSTSNYSGSGTITYVVYGTDATSQTLDLSREAVTDGYIVPKGGSTSITNIVVTYKVANYSDFRTSVSSVTLTEDVTIAGDLNVSSYTLTIPIGKKLTVNGTLTTPTAANLIIEDGGQLITSNAVAATVQKSIAAWTTVEGKAGNWFFIASPLSAEYTPTGTMTSNDFDLYRLNPSKTDLPWENYKNSEAAYYHFHLDNGRGYLYANSNTTTLAFTGAINPYPTNQSVSVSTGWNLVGNPFTFNVYANQNYYKMNEKGTAIASVTKGTETIAPCTGIVVEANASGSVIFSKEAPAGSANNGNLELTLTQAVANSNTRGESVQTLDNAIVSFNEGSELGKFYFGNQNANIYIPRDNKEYAIVSAEARGEMPVCFKAAQDGQYTLTVNAEEVEMGYLHLIDNISGTDIDLLATPSYTFSALNDDYESRFRLVFSANGMNNENGNDDFAFISNGQLIIANNGEATLQVVDITGRILSSEVINGSCSKTINAASGVYVLRLVNGSNVKTQKIVVR